MMTMSRRTMLRLSAFGAVAMAAPLSAPRLARAADPVKVGALFPLSGGAAPQGQHVSQAIENSRIPDNNIAVAVMATVHCFFGNLFPYFTRNHSIKGGSLLRILVSREDPEVP